MHIGPAEFFGVDGIIILVVVVLVLFGSTQIPKLARSLGSAQKEFKKGLDEGASEDGADQGGRGAASGGRGPPRRPRPPPPAPPPSRSAPTGPTASRPEPTSAGHEPRRRAQRRRRTTGSGCRHRAAVPVLGPPARELIAAVVLVDLSVHVRDGGTLIAAVGGLRPPGRGGRRATRPRADLSATAPRRTGGGGGRPGRGGPGGPGPRPDIEGIIVLEFVAVGLIRLATLTRTSGATARRSRTGAGRRRSSTPPLRSSIPPPPGRAPPTAPAGRAGAATESAARRAGRAAGVAAARASGAATHRPAAEAQVKRALRGAGRWLAASRQRLRTAGRRRPERARTGSSPGARTERLVDTRV